MLASVTASRSASNNLLLMLLTDDRPRAEVRSTTKPYRLTINPHKGLVDMMGTMGLYPDRHSLADYLTTHTTLLKGRMTVVGRMLAQMFTALLLAVAVRKDPPTGQQDRPLGA